MSGAMTERQASNVAAIRGAFERVNRDGPSALLDRYDEWFTDDLEWVPRVVGALERRTYRGREGLAAWGRDLSEALDKFEYHDLAYQALGEEVVLVVGQMTTQGQSSRVPVEVDASWVFELRGGRVARMRSFPSQREAREEAERAAAQAPSASTAGIPDEGASR